jgi:ribosomal protein S27AE
METRLTPTNHPCWKCGGMLAALDPPVSGWRFHCGRCRHLTSPRADLGRALAERPEGSAGVVSAVACRIEARPSLA